MVRVKETASIPVALLQVPANVPLTPVTSRVTLISPRGSSFEICNVPVALPAVKVYVPVHGISVVVELAKSVDEVGSVTLPQF